MNEPSFEVLQVLKLGQMVTPTVLGDLRDIVAIVDSTWQIGSQLSHGCEDGLFEALLFDCGSIHLVLRAEILGDGDNIVVSSDDI